MDDSERLILAGAVKRGRLAKGWGKEQAAREARVSSITWKRVEDGQRVQDAKLAAVLAAVDISDDELDDAALEYAEGIYRLADRISRDYVAAGGDEAQAAALMGLATEIRARYTGSVSASHATWWPDIKPRTKTEKEDSDEPRYPTPTMTGTAPPAPPSTVGRRVRMRPGPPTAPIERPLSDRPRGDSGR
jgi:transcriptional regulator with XRE-family HTH domain